MNSLTKKTGIYFVGNMASKFLTALIVPIYALYVDAESLGNYDLLLTISSILSPLAFCAMWEGILKFTLVASNDQKKSYISTALRLSIPVALVVSAAQVVVCGAVGWEWNLSLALALMVLMSGISTSWQYCTRALGKSHDYVVSGVLGSAISFTLIIVFVCLLHGQLFGLILSYLFGQLFIVLYLEYKISVLSSVVHDEFDKVIARRLLKYCFPCVFNLLSIHLLTGIGRIAISYNLGASANGQYAFAMKFASLITAAGSIFSMAVIEEGIIREKKGRLGHFFSQLMNSLSSLVVSLAILSIPAILVFYIFIGDTAYWESFKLIPVLIAYAVFSVLSTVFGSTFMSLGRTSWNMWTTFFGLILCAPVSVILVRQIGILGAGMGLALGSFCMMISRAFISMQMVGYRIKWGRILFLSVCYCVVCVSALRILDGCEAPLDLFLLVLLSISTAPFIYKNARALFCMSD